MRLEIMGFNQRSLVALKLSLEDAVLLRWFVDFQNTRKMEVVSTPDNAIYFWVNMEKVCRDLPILTRNARWMSQRFNKLVEAGVLIKHEQPSKKGRKACFRLNDEIYFLLTDNTQAMLVKTDMGDEAMSVNSDMPMSVNSDMPLYINNINKISNNLDNLLDDNYSSEPSEEAPSSPVFIELPLNNGSLFTVTEEQVGKWSKLYPAVDVRQQLRTMLGWCESNPTKRKTSKGIARFVNSWLAREQDRGGSKRSYSGTNAQVSNPISNAAFAGAKGGEEEW